MTVRKTKRLEAQLLQSSKLASIGQLASGLTHEINNSLGTILMRSHNLQKNLADLNVPDDVRDDVKAIERQADRIYRITRELLGFARNSSPEQVPTDLGEVIDSSVSLVNLRASKHGVTVKRQDECELPPVMGNRTQLEQVFVNILNNAIDASDPQSVVTIGAEEIFTDDGDHLIEIWVRDHGIGIPEEDLERVFEPFYTTKDADKGTGLGLSISYDIVSTHNGTIEASRHPDGGTVFHVRLPVLSGPRAEETA